MTSGHYGPQVCSGIPFIREFDSIIILADDMQTTI